MAQLGQELASAVVSLDAHGRALAPLLAIQASHEDGFHVPPLPALGSFRTYVGLLRYNFGAKRPNYLPTQLPSAASGRKTYLPTYLPIRRPPRKNLPTVPTFYSHF